MQVHCPTCPANRLGDQTIPTVPVDHAIAYCSPGMSDEVMQKQRGPLGTIRAGYPMQIVAIDIQGPLPKTKEGNMSWLLITSPGGWRHTTSVTRRMSQSPRNWWMTTYRTMSGLQQQHSDNHWLHSIFPNVRS